MTARQWELVKLSAGAAIAPFVMVSAYLIVVPQPTWQSGGVLLIVSISAGVVCLAWMPINLLARLALTLLYVPALLMLISFFALYVFTYRFQFLR